MTRSILGSYWTLAVGADPTGHKPQYCPRDFNERVEAAAKAGFTGMGFWHTDLAHLRERYSFAEMKRVLDANGIRDIEVEFLLDWFEDGERRARSDVTRKLLLDAAEMLGAKHIKIGDFENTQCPDEKLSESFAHLCAEAEARGVNVLFEIVPAEFCRLHSLDAGLKLVRDAGAKNGGLILDMWHCVRNGTTAAEVAAKLDPTMPLAVELNDGLLERPKDMFEATVHRRLLPGDGEFDIVSMVRALDSIGYRGAWGVEVLNAELRQKNLSACAEAAFAATREILAAADNAR